MTGPHPGITEDGFMDAVFELAKLNKWRVTHIPKVRDHRGTHRTPIRYDGKGFPDLLLTHTAGFVIFTELKTDKAPGPRNEQAVWRDHLLAVEASVGADSRSARPCVEYHLWRPRDWDSIVRTLTITRSTP